MILAISNNKGGTLKSTSTVNLAAINFQSGSRVLIVDADNQGNASLAFGVNPDNFEKTLYHAMTGRDHPDDCIYRLIGDTPDGPCIDILPSNDAMAMFDLEVTLDHSNWEHRFDHMRNTLTRIATDYDVILIDTPPNIGVTVGNVLTAADGVLVPFQPERYSMRSLTKILQTVHDFRAVQNSRLDFVGMFPVLVNRRTRLHREIIKQGRAYSKETGFTMFKSQIPHSIREASSTAYEDRPLALTDPEHNISKAYRKLWAEVEKSMKKMKKGAAVK